MKGFVFAFLVASSLQIYDTPTLLNPTRAEEYMKMNGGIGSQGYWGALQPSQFNVFSPKWSKDGYKQVYNVNSIAPFNGDRYTGYDSLTQMFSPQGSGSNFYHPISENVNADESASPNMADINTQMYRDYYARYYNFYNKNLDMLKSKFAHVKDPLDFNNMDERRRKHPEDFDYAHNFFDQLPIGETMVGHNLPSIQTVRGAAAESRKLVLNPNLPSPEYIQELKDKARELRSELKALKRSHLRRFGKSRKVYIQV